MKNIVYVLIILCLGLVSCENQDREFPGFDYSSVYFATQFPVRTITLGDDEFDTTLDNQWKFKVYGTLAGVYSNKKDITIDVTVDNSLTDNLLFNGGGEEIIPLPSNYYQLNSDQIVISKGNLVGGVEVQLTQAFFDDPNAIKKTYVLPLRMTNVINADTILSGKALVANPNPSIMADWQVVPKNFVLYALKYINPWHGSYLRRGTDIIIGKNGNTALNDTKVRKAAYVERDEVNNLVTESLKKVVFPLTIKDKNNVNIVSNLLITFDDNGNCTVAAAQSGYTATGSGKFIKKGEKKSWGNKDRDALYLEYEIDHPQIHVSTKDTLVLRNRGVGLETFSPVLN